MIESLGKFSLSKSNKTLFNLLKHMVTGDGDFDFVVNDEGNFDYEINVITKNKDECCCDDCDCCCSDKFEETSEQSTEKLEQQVEQRNFAISALNNIVEKIVADKQVYSYVKECMKNNAPLTEDIIRALGSIFISTVKSLYQITIELHNIKPVADSAIELATYITEVPELMEIYVSNFLSKNPELFKKYQEENKIDAADIASHFVDIHQLYLEEPIDEVKESAENSEDI